MFIYIYIYKDIYLFIYSNNMTYIYRCINISIYDHIFLLHRARTITEKLIQCQSCNIISLTLDSP